MYINDCGVIVTNYCIHPDRLHNEENSFGMLSTEISTLVYFKTSAYLFSFMILITLNVALFPLSFVIPSDGSSK